MRSTKRWACIGTCSVLRSSISKPFTVQVQLDQQAAAGVCSVSLSMAPSGTRAVSICLHRLRLHLLTTAGASCQCPERGEGISLQHPCSQQQPEATLQLLPTGGVWSSDERSYAVVFLDKPADGDTAIVLRVWPSLQTADGSAAGFIEHSSPASSAAHPSTQLKVIFSPDGSWVACTVPAQRGEQRLLLVHPSSGSRETLELASLVLDWAWLGPSRLLVLLATGPVVCCVSTGARWQLPSAEWTATPPSRVAAMPGSLVLVCPSRTRLTVLVLLYKESAAAALRLSLQASRTFDFYRCVTHCAAVQVLCCRAASRSSFQPPVESQGKPSPAVTAADGVPSDQLLCRWLDTTWHHTLRLYAGCAAIAICNCIDLASTGARKHGQGGICIVSLREHDCLKPLYWLPGEDQVACFAGDGGRSVATSGKSSDRVKVLDLAGNLLSEWLAPGAVHCGQVRLHWGPGGCLSLRAEREGSSVCVQLIQYGQPS